MERCTRCLLPRNFPRTLFDENGVCEYCQKYVPRKLLGKEALLEVIRKHKQPGAQYDCVVALSGGRDSTYTLYYLVHELGLKAAAYTVDHGYLPQETMENIQRATSTLQVDHKFYPHDLSLKAAGPMLKAWIHRPDPAMVSTICLGCRFGLHRAFRETARSYKATLVIGAGEPGSDEYFGARFFSARSEYPIGKLEILFGFGGKLLANPRYLMNATIPSLLVKEYLGVFAPWQRQPSDAIKIICMYHYIDWDEPRIQSTIERELGWRRYGASEAPWRADCKLAVLKNQMYLRSMGFMRNDILVSALVRAGKLTKAAGLARLEAENRAHPDVVAELCQEVADIRGDLFARIGETETTS